MVNILKGTFTLKNISFKMNIYVKQSSVLVTKGRMASFERRFLTIKVTKFASTEAEVLVITILSMVCCLLILCDLRCLSAINWLIRVHKHIQQGECDVLPLST